MNTRGTTPRSRTIGMRELSRLKNRPTEDTSDVDDIPRPRVRADCINGPRPCPWVSCKHHLFLDVSENGSIKLNFPNVEVWEMPETCALDVADRQENNLAEVGRILNLTKERARQIEEKTLRAVRSEARRRLAVIG